MLTVLSYFVIMCLCNLSSFTAFFIIKNDLFERYSFYTVPAVQLENTAILKNVESLLFGELLHVELHLIMKWHWLSRYVYVDIHFVDYSKILVLDLLCSQPSLTSGYLDLWYSPMRFSVWRCLKDDTGLSWLPSTLPLVSLLLAWHLPHTKLPISLINDQLRHVFCQLNFFTEFFKFAFRYSHPCE